MSAMPILLNKKETLSYSYCRILFLWPFADLQKTSQHDQLRVQLPFFSARGKTSMVCIELNHHWQMIPTKHSFQQTKYDSIFKQRLYHTVYVRLWKSGTWGKRVLGFFRNGKKIYIKTLILLVLTCHAASNSVRGAVIQTLKYLLIIFSEQNPAHFIQIFCVQKM